MKTNFKITLAAIIGFVAGDSAGFFFQTVDTTEDSAKGDIAKVSKFSKNVVSPAMSAFQEKITSNPEELEKATTSLTVLTSRMTEFDELVNIATTVSEGNEELATSVRNLRAPQDESCIFSSRPRHYPQTLQARRSRRVSSST